MQATDFSQAEMKYIRDNGFFVMKSCDDFKKLMGNLYKTAKMFIGGMGLNPRIPIFGSKIHDYQLKANIEFTKENIGYEWKMLKEDKLIIIDKK